MVLYISIAVVFAVCLFFVFKYRSKFLFMRNLLWDTEQTGEKIIQSIPDMIFIFDSSFRVLKIYNADEKKLLVPVSQLIGKDMRLCLDQKFVGLLEESIQETIKSDGLYEIEYDIETPEGVKYFEGRFLKIKKNEFACFVRDITERKKNQILLQQNQDILNSILDSIPFPVMLKDVDDGFRYIYWNKECEEQGGFNRMEILGKTDTDIYGEERGKYYEAIGREIVSKGEPYRNQEIFVTPDGKEHVSWVYKNVINSGSSRWLLVTRWDITDLALAEKSLREVNRINRLILDNTHIGFVFLTPDYVVQWENLSVYSHHPIALRFQKGTLVTCSACHADGTVCVMKRAMESGKPEQKIEIFEDGTMMEIIATPVYTDQSELQGVVLRVEDVTVKKRIARELEQAKEDAEKSDRLKSAFLANMSHEIRTPLNAILGFSELLCQSDTQSDRQAYMKIIESNNDLLLQLINDILDLSKIEANTLEFVYSDVDVNETLKELEKSSQLKIVENPKLQINFQPELPRFVIHTERNRFLQVVSNFITNAVKFTDEGEITFGYKVLPKEIYFYVKDTGSGIPQDKREEIFNRFVKLDSFKTGTGLGLSICQMIVRKLGGKIGVESQEGKGSEFWFTLPSELIKNEISEEPDRKPFQETASVPEEKAVRILGKPTLLIAEDTVDNYKLYQIFLSKDYTLLHAWNGREAVELFREHRPDAILMDIKMPEMDGYEATAIIRGTDPYVPIIAVTAFAYPEDRKRILESGFSAYLTKPITSASLAKVLKTLES